MTTTSFYRRFMFFILAYAVAALITISTAHADDLKCLNVDCDAPAAAPPAHRPAFSVVFKPLRGETAWEEYTWQGLNVIDTMQTVQIAKNPKCYQEVGTLSLITGNHPSEGQAIWGGALFGVLHYGVTRLVENLVDSDEDYRVIQRVWQVGGFILKGYNDYNNNQIGLGLTSSRGC